MIVQAWNKISSKHNLTGRNKKISIQRINKISLSHQFEKVIFGDEKKKSTCVVVNILGVPC